MRSFTRELSEKELGYMPKRVSRYIAGYLTCRNKVRYQVNIKGVFGGTFLTFEEADKKRREMLREMEGVK